MTDFDKFFDTATINSLASVQDDYTGKTLLHSVHTMFSERCEQYASDLTNYVATHNLTQTLHILHKLKGTTLSIGATALTYDLVQLSKTIKKDDWSKALELVANVKATMFKSMDMLNDYIHELESKNTHKVAS